jgi:hypothetical protein
MAFPDLVEECLRHGQIVTVRDAAVAAVETSRRLS